MLLLTACSAPALQEQKSPPLVTTTGEAEILVVPDEVVLTLAVETPSMQLSVAKQLNDEGVGWVFDGDCQVPFTTSREQGDSGLCRRSRGSRVARPEACDPRMMS